MRSEIGSEFWDVPVSATANSLFPENTQWFISGRSALKYIIEDSGIKSISMPIWCCSSMVTPFKDAGIEVEFYSDNTPSETMDAIYLLDYFGYSTSQSPSEDYEGVIIRDLTQSLFSGPYNDADYYFGSLRKWAGFWTGGYAYGNWQKIISIPPPDYDYITLRKEAMKCKKAYIYEKSTNKDYLNLFSAANIRLQAYGIMGAAERDIQYAKYLDTNIIQLAHQRNAMWLHQNFHNTIFSFSPGDCPLFVPIAVDPKYRNTLRDFLVDWDIYLPIHWPKFDLFGSELSLVCDQRYSIDNMKQICDAVSAFFEDITN